MRKLHFILAFTTIVCEAQVRQNLNYDTAAIAILNIDSLDDFRPFTGSIKPALLTDDDLKVIEVQLAISIKEYNLKESEEQKKHKSPFTSGLINRLTTYKRQYVAVLNNLGEKEVHVNCFCMTSEKGWRKYLIIVDGGGACFFNLTINLTHKKRHSFWV